MSGAERWHECASEFPLNQVLLILEKKTVLFVAKYFFIVKGTLL